MNHPSQQMFLIFKNDLKKNISFFNQLLDHLSKKSFTKEDFENAQKIFHEIFGVTKLLQTTEIEKLSGALKKIFSQKDLSGVEKLDLESGIAQAIQLLIELSDIPEKQLFVFEKKHASFIDSFACRAQSLKDSSPPRPIAALSIKETDTKYDASSDSHMIDLFKIELENQAKTLNEQLILYEQTRDNSHFEALMRAAHSIKGAAKVLDISSLIQLAHLLEECFVSAKQKKINLGQNNFDILFEAADFFSQLSKINNREISHWIEGKHSEIENLNLKISGILKPDPENNPLLQSEIIESVKENIKSKNQEKGEVSPLLDKGDEPDSDRVLRVSSQSLNRLMGLAGESMVESRWLNPFSDALIKLKKKQNEISILFENLKDSLKDYDFSEVINHNLSDIQQKIQESRQNLTDRLADLEMFISRHSSLTDRLYNEVIESRMRPFADGVEAFPRLTRDLAKELNKKVRLEIIGKRTPVDRDILEKLEIPLSHLLRNAIDHGIEPPPMRVLAGKPMEGIITIEARHLAGMLSINFSDDGRGLDFNKIRQTIFDKRMIKGDIVDKLTENELLEFLFLPGFTTSAQVTEISGRGIGLNIVHNLVQGLTGSIRIINKPGLGLTISLQLPLTLSVIRALIADIAGEPYAFPLARIEQAVEIPESAVKIIENRQYFNFLGQNIGIIPASQILHVQAELSTYKIYSVIILSDHSQLYGVVVDNFLGEKEMVVHELDPRLGKIPNISSGSLLDDGNPVLIVDVDDMIQTIDQLLSQGTLPTLASMEKAQKSQKKHILVVDDSLTVREVECRLLRNKGYEVETAVNGVEAWNAVRIGKFNLIITDVDMPRMNGIELVRNIKGDTRFKNIPIMIVSYKEREGDRLLGLEAGANYYLTKSSFHDETLLNAVIDLIGPP